MTRTCHNGVKEAFAAEEHIFHTGNGLDIHLAGWAHSSQITGIQHDLLARSQFVFDNMTIKFCKYHTVTGYFLQNEAFAAEQTRAEFFMEMSRQFDRRFRCEESGLLQDQFLSRLQFKRNNGSREAGCKGNEALTSLTPYSS